MAPVGPVWLVWRAWPAQRGGGPGCGRRGLGRRRLRLGCYRLGRNRNRLSLCDRFSLCHGSGAGHPLVGFRACKRAIGASTKQHERDRKEGCDARKSTGCSDPCVVTQGVEGDHVFYLGISGRRLESDVKNSSESPPSSNGSE